jgi:glycoprotein endo-alpha-1,2-mannosidase
VRAGFLITLIGLVAGLGSGGEITVSAYYYPWYGAGGQHWELGYDGQKDGRGPLAGEYDSRSPEVIARHLALSREMGIDNWVCSWWGPDSSEDVTLRDHVLPVLAAAREKGEVTPTFCLFYEAAGLLGLDSEEKIHFDSATIHRFAGHFRFIADEYFSHPAYRRVGGKPVVYLYLSRTFAGDVPRALAAIRAIGLARGFEFFLVGDEVYWGEPDPERIRLYDAVTPYNMHGPTEYAGLTDWTPFLADCDRVYTRWREVATSLGVEFIPGVMPGFDSRGVDPTAHYVIPRRLRPDAGPLSTFATMSEMAKKHLDPALREVTITSFNEWHEGTAIETAKGEEESAATVIRSVFGE